MEGRSMKFGKLFPIVAVLVSFSASAEPLLHYIGIFDELSEIHAEHYQHQPHQEFLSVVNPDAKTVVVKSNLPEYKAFPAFGIAISEGKTQATPSALVAVELTILGPDGHVLFRSGKIPANELTFKRSRSYSDVDKNVRYLLPTNENPSLNKRALAAAKLEDLRRDEKDKHASAILIVYPEKQQTLGESYAIHMSLVDLEKMLDVLPSGRKFEISECLDILGDWKSRSIH
jgi:hypothetical protein